MKTRTAKRVMVLVVVAVLLVMSLATVALAVGPMTGAPDWVEPGDHIPNPNPDCPGDCQL